MEQKYEYRVRARERIGNIYRDKHGVYVARNSDQLVFLLNKANIRIDSLELIGETNHSISLP